MTFEAGAMGWSEGAGLDSFKAYFQGKESVECRYYYFAALTGAHQFAYAARKYLAIENQLYRCLDVLFREDDSRTREDLSPLNLNVLRKTALALYKDAAFGNRLACRKTLLGLRTSFRAFFQCFLNTVVRMFGRRTIADPELKLFQCTAIDEYSRYRVLGAYPEQSTYSSAYSVQYV